MIRTLYKNILSGNKLILVLFSFTLLIMLSCSSDSTEPQSEDMILKFSPAEQTAPENTEVEYSVLVENIQGLFAFSAEIAFNNSVAELVQDAVVIGDIWNSETVEMNVVEEDRLSITISLQQSPDVDSIDGDGALFSFSIIGNTIGQTSLEFEELQLIDENGNDIPNLDDIIITNGNLIVE